MKEKMFFRMVLIAGAATMLAACTSESENGPSANISYESIAAAQQVPVTFGTYMGETATTRYGATGAIDGTSSTLAAQVLANKGGFGVFGYYTDNGNYNNTTSLPNFMYNQHVTGTDENPPVWSYTPIKYWPNEYDAGATSEGTDRLTFFAYAPYTTVTPNTGVPTTGAEGVSGSGITALTNNYSDGGDPKVSYTVAQNPANSVDLLYGVVGTATNNGPFGTGGDAIAVGGQYIDITKQAVSGKINFDFKHALARLNLTIQGAFDDDEPTVANVAAGTKITVQSVVINGAYFYDSGKLNLNGGTWGNLSGGTATDNMTIDATHYINPDIVDLGADDTHVQVDSDGSDALDDSLFGPDNTVTGITNTEKSVATGGDFMIIPSSTTITGITITYFVNTKDENLAAGYSRVKNVITKNFVSAINVAAGTAYKIKLNVGMTTVKVEASVTPWTSVNNEVWLPINTD